MVGSCYICCMSVLRDTLPKRLIQARKHTGLRRCDFARMMGVSARSVERWEKGQRIPSLEDLCKYAVFAGVALCWLLSDVDEARARIAAEAMSET